MKGSAPRGRLRHLEHLFHAGTVGDLSDGELLDRFLRCRDEAGESAFAALVERHGPMVFRVCRQTLSDSHAAEDAAQATFLVLARQAGTIRKRPSVSSWLFGVARRAAARIRMQEARRRQFESRSAERSSALGFSQAEPADLDPYPELHAEIGRLPEKYRLPIVLCYFEGLTHEQAASRLRWPVGTVKTRLSRGRERLRSRLEQSGWPALLPLPASSLRPGIVAELTAHLLGPIARMGYRCATHGSPGALASSTVLEIAREVMRSMLMHNLKSVAVTMSGLVLLGFGVLVAAQQATEKGRTGHHDAVITETHGAPSSVLKLPGFTTIHQTVRIRPGVAGVVRKVQVVLGQKVKKGDPLLEISSTKLAAAKSDYEAASVQHALDQKVLELSARLPADNAVSRQAIIVSQGDEAKSRTEVERARNKLLAVGLTEDEIKHVLLEDGTQRARMILRSPLDGSIIERAVHPGEVVSDVAQSLLIVAQIDPDPFPVEARVPEKALEKVKIGQDLTVTFPSFPDRRVKGKVEAIDPRKSDPSDHTVILRTSVANPDHRYKAGMYATVQVDTEARHDGIDPSRNAPERPPSATIDERLNALERKLDQLLNEKVERPSDARLLERLDTLERKVDQLFDRRREESP
jgi:RND family efflux transporter MFP subunit